jgi:hypothetical protein
MLRSFRNNYVFLSVTTFVLFLSFAFNFFGTITTDEFILNYKSSESLVTNQVLCKGEVFSGQLLDTKGGYYSNPSLKECNIDSLSPYFSQYGLQGKIYTGVYKNIIAIKPVSIESYIAFAQLITALSSAFVLALVAMWVKKTFSFFESVIFVGLVAMSPMLVGFARNLYWALPLIFLPLIFTLFYYAIPSKKNIKKDIIFWFFLGFLLYLRYLNGYEYITTITIMIMSAIAYKLYISKSNKKTYIIQFLMIGFVSVFAFGLALGTHIYSLNDYSGSTSESVSLIKDRALKRTSESGRYLSYPYGNYKFLANDVYRIDNTYLGLDRRVNNESELWSNSIALKTYTLLPVIKTPVKIAEPFSTYLYSLGTFSIVLIFLFVKRKKFIPKRSIRKVEGLFLATFIGFVGFISWLILARSHSLVHAHINGVLLYMPFALFGFMIVAIFIKSAIYKKRK